jgi:hypothetical protein
MSTDINNLGVSGSLDLLSSGECSSEALCQAVLDAIGSRDETRGAYRTVDTEEVR